MLHQFHPWRESAHCVNLSWVMPTTRSTFSQKNKQLAFCILEQFQDKVFLLHTVESMSNCSNSLLGKNPSTLRSQCSLISVRPVSLQLKTTKFWNPFIHIYSFLRLMEYCRETMMNTYTHIYLAEDLAQQLRALVTIT